MGGKWKGVILGQLHTRGTLRFGELRRLPPARLAQQALTMHLRELEADDVIHREAYAGPLKADHSLMARAATPGRCWTPFVDEFRNSGGRACGRGCLLRICPSLRSGSGWKRTPSSRRSGARRVSIALSPACRPGRSAGGWHRALRGRRCASVRGVAGSRRRAGRRQSSRAGCHLYVLAVSAP